MKFQSATYIKHFSVVIAAIVFIMGCADKSSHDLGKVSAIEKNTELPLSSEQKNTRSEDNHHSHHGHKQSKPGAAVSLRNTEPLYVTGPGVHEFQLELLSTNHVGKMVVGVSATEGLTILSSIHNFEFELTERGRYTVPVVINASREGRFYIQLNLSITANDATSSRVIAAIVQVGESAVKAQKTGVKNTDQNGETVISLPSQETISPR